MDLECLYPNYIVCYGAFRDFIKFTFVCVSFSQIFVGKFELWREAWGIGVIGGMVGLGLGLMAWEIRG